MKWLGRIFVFIAGLVVIAAAVLFVLGRRADAGRNTVEVEIARPAADVYPYLTEPDKIIQWVGGMVEGKSLTEPPLRPGSRGESIVEDPNQPGVRFTMKDEVVAFEPNKSIMLRIWSDGAFYGVIKYQLTESNGKTRLKYDGKFQYIPWFARLMEPIITPSAQKKSEKDMAKLKSLMESRP